MLCDEHFDMFESGGYVQEESVPTTMIHPKMMAFS
jgi:hypothetical protein